MDDLTYHTATDQRCKSSAIEQEIIGKIRDLGIPIVDQVKFNAWVFDGAVNGTRLLIEIHGDYWHTRPEVEERDGRKQEWADQNGYLILTIWEADYQRDPDAELLKVFEVYDRAKEAAALTDAVMETLEGNKSNTPPAIPAVVYGTWRDRFLAVLSESGIVREACIAAGVARKTAYAARKDDETFAEAWKLAQQDAADLALATYRKRAMQQSDRAMEFFIKSRDPESYRERSEVQTKHSGAVEHVHMSLDEWKAQAAARLADAEATLALCDESDPAEPGVSNA